MRINNPSADGPAILSEPISEELNSVRGTFHKELGEAYLEERGFSFLDGDRIPGELWADLVSRIHEASSSVIVLAHRLDKDWSETSWLRQSVVKAGGILEEMALDSFHDSVSMIVRRIETSISGVKAGEFQMPAPSGPVATWELYSGSYMTAEEFRDFLPADDGDTIDSKSCIS